MSRHLWINKEVEVHRCNIPQVLFIHWLSSIAGTDGICIRWQTPHWWSNYWSLMELIKQAWKSIWHLWPALAWLTSYLIEHSVFPIIIIIHLLYIYQYYMWSTSGLRPWSFVFLSTYFTSWPNHTYLWDVYPVIHFRNEKQLTLFFSIIKKSRNRNSLKMLIYLQGICNLLCEESCCF